LGQNFGRGNYDGTITVTNNAVLVSQDRVELGLLGASGGAITSRVQGAINVLVGGEFRTTGNVTLGMIQPGILATQSVAVGTLNVKGGTFVATNGSGTALLDVSRPWDATGFVGVNGATGVVNLTSGTLLVDRLVATNGVFSKVTFTGGTLALKDSVTLGTAITAGGTLSGNGYVTGITNITGTLSPGFSVGALTFSNDVTFGSTATNVIEVTGTNSDSVVVIGTATLGGNLTVTAGLPTPTNGHSITVLTGTAVGGAFATTNLPNANYTLVQSATAVVLNYSTGGSPPVANFTATPTNGVAPLTVVFTDTSSGGPATWAWDFNNDGFTDSSDPNPTNVFAAGNYTVRLIACNGNGCDTNTKTAFLNVLTVQQSWEAYYGVSVDGADADGDGLSNADEFAVGFNPTNSAAYLHIISVTKSGTDLDITYLGANGDTNYAGGPLERTNVLEIAIGVFDGSYTNDFLSTGQTNILSGGTGAGLTTSFIETNGATYTPARYYRVRALVP
jgi:PKD repeat protein